MGRDSRLGDLASLRPYLGSLYRVQAIAKAGALRQGLIYGTLCLQWVGCLFHQCWPGFVTVAVGYIADVLRVGMSRGREGSLDDQKEWQTHLPEHAAAAYEIVALAASSWGGPGQYNATRSIRCDIASEAKGVVLLMEAKRR